MQASFAEILESLLPFVERPSRYVGGEWNTVRKDPDAVRLRLCLFFPDVYELGLGNLGLHILYGLLNRMDGVWAERAYTPAPDMAALLRSRGLAPFMLESGDPVTAAHAVGFTLQSELTYVNVLAAIEMAGLPLRADVRDGNMPLIFAGGPGAYNPEPLAPFMDFFVIGDGEEVILEIAEILLRFRGRSRRETLAVMGAVPGVYVPGLYPTERLPDGRIIPKEDGRTVLARRVSALANDAFPQRYIVPYAQLTHDGIGLEVLRGCTHGCRFCQGGMISRPVRERDAASAGELIAHTLDGTGFEDVTLLSLSTCDHSQVRALLRTATARAHPRQSAVALPSLRLDRFSVDLAEHVSPLRRSGLTFAPEAGSDRLRAVINKPVTDEALEQIAEEVFRRGWTHIKTYFMIGLPTETDADIRAIAALCIRLWETGRRVQPRAAIRMGVSTFVPKPITPFQWARQIGVEETVEKQRMILEVLRPFRGIKFGRHLPETSFIEGLISRSGREAAPLLEAALRHGAGYETWDERVNRGAWEAAIRETGFDAVAALRERPEDGRLPWDHIQAAVAREALLEEWRRARQGVLTPDCREGTCNRCGADISGASLCALMRARSQQGGAADRGIMLDAVPRVLETQAAAQRIRLRIGREGRLRFLSHLETVQAWVRALRRARAPLAYSRGFHAHPKITFATAPPVGEASEDDLMDVMLTEYRSPEALIAALREVLPSELRVYEAWEAPLRSPALMSLVSGFAYRIVVPLDQAELAQRLEHLHALREWRISRRTKGAAGGCSGAFNESGAALLDIRPMVTAFRAEADSSDAGCVVVVFETAMRDGRLAKPKEILRLLGVDPLAAHVRKMKTHLHIAAVSDGG